MKYFIGDITIPPVNAIAHQCNCTTYGQASAKGVAAVIFKAFPYADVYRMRGEDREAFNEMGSVHVGMPPGFPGKPATKEAPIVFNLMGQKRGGRPRLFSGDDAAKRVSSMVQCLDIVGSEIRTLGVKELAVPYGIGCGMAGGDWSVYSRRLRNFEEKSGCGIILVVLPQFAHVIDKEDGEYYDPDQYRRTD